MFVQSHASLRTVLGLDLGTSSVGWALLGLDENGNPDKLIDLGVRHFEEVVTAKTRELKNAKRRTSRMARTNLRRRRQRRDNVLSTLRALGLAPVDATPFAAGDHGKWHPYELRSLAASQPISLGDLGRALFHLARRRGFKSNRGAKLASLGSEPEIAHLVRKPAEEDEDPETGRILAEIEQIRTDMGVRTLGQYYWDELNQGRKVRGRHTDRAMYEKEFETIWDVQRKAYPQLNDVARARVYDAIFSQRPLKIQKFLKAKCSLEPSKVRAERAQLVSQRFRYWQDLCNLILTDGSTGEVRPLTLKEKQTLATKLELTKSLGWASVRSALALPKNTTFNLERAKGGELKGNRTACQVRSILGERWDQLDAPTQERFVETLLTIDDRGQLYRTLRSRFGLIPDVAYKLAIADLEPGTASLSSKAMRRILLQMQEGLSRTDAQIRCGYEPWTEDIEPSNRIESVPSQRELPNPRVRKALGQLRKVMNAIVATYGRPTIIRIEMARDLSLTQAERANLEKSQKDLAAVNKRADEALGAMGISNPTRSDRFWYRLGEQCGWVCPYSGKPIPQSVESMSRFQIEHIVPYVRSLDDSFNNLTLCDAELNRTKGNRTPFEAFGSTTLWPDMVARVQQWKGYGAGHKRRLFLEQEAPDEEKMVSRQLNETRAICRLAAGFVRPLCSQVEATKGQATAMLRARWRLMEALYGVNEKSRDDLRHHAVDAVAVAFTSRSLFGAITKHRKRRVGDRDEDYKVPPLSDKTVPPEPTWLFQALSQRLSTTIVSHEATHAIQGAFHEETAMGLRDLATGTYHYRKQLVEMTLGDVNSIVDSKLRDLCLCQLREGGGQPRKAFAEGVRVGGTVARSARILKVLPKAPMVAVPRDAPIKHYKQGNNHHVEIFEDIETGKRFARYVTALQAAERVRSSGKTTVVDTTGPIPSMHFVMWLAPNDIVTVGGSNLMRIASLWSTTNQIEAFSIETATRENKDLRKLPQATSNGIQKYEVDPLGRVRKVREGIV